MTTVSRGEITITNVNDGETSHVHTAYAWSADGTDRFAKVYPNENLFLVKEWEKLPERPNPQFISLLEIQLEPSTNYTLSTNIPNWADNTTCDLFLLDSKAEPSSTINGVAINKPRTIKTLTDGIIVIGCRNYEFSSGTHWVKLEKGSTPTIYTPAPSEDYENAYPTYLGTYSSFEEESSLSPYDYTWSLIKGLDGHTPYFHTAYTNSTDFGAYDYSGNPNLFLNPTFSDLSSDAKINTPVQSFVTDNGESFTVDLTSVTGDRVFYFNNLPTLLKHTPYTYSIEAKADINLPNGIRVRPVYIDENSKTQYVFPTIIPNMTTSYKRYSYTHLNLPLVYLNSNFHSLQFYFPADVPRTKITIKYNIKTEKGTEATPYQPNLKDDPWYFSTVSLGENIRKLDEGKQPPYTTTDYMCYVGRINGLWEADETYTVTINATKPATQTFGLYLLNGSQPAGNLTPVEGLTDTWSVTFKVTKEMIDEGVTNHANIFQIPQSTKGEVKVNWVKIEKGSVPTPNIDSYKYLGNYTDFVQADSLNPTKYSWSLIKGVDGETSHAHTAYAWSADGTDRFTKVYPGENYVKNSRRTLELSNVTNNGNYLNGDVPYNLADLVGKTVTISVEIEVNNAQPQTSGSIFRIGCEASIPRASGSKFYLGVWENLSAGQTIATKRISRTLSIPNDIVAAQAAGLHLYVQANGDYFRVSKPKIEIGDTPTIYTPSPSEDYENAYPTYTGTYSDFNVEGSDNPKDYTWARSMGNAGESAKTLILSTSSNTVKINQDSSIQSDTITLQANMQNMTGIATFSATPYIGARPQTAITLGGTGNTRTFSTSSWDKNWTSLVVTATFESFIDKQTIISVKEGKDGADSITGLLTNESVTLPADKNGIVESFSEASGTFKVFDGLSDVTGRNVVYTLKNKSGGTFNINASTGVYNMTEMSKDSAIAVFEATYKNIKIEKILSVAKSKAGKETYTYTKYSNSKDFGDYDYSGNPNLMNNLSFSDFAIQAGGGTISDGGKFIKINKTSGNNLFVMAGYKNSAYYLTPVLPNTTYTITYTLRKSSNFVPQSGKRIIARYRLNQNNVTHNFGELILDSTSLTEEFTTYTKTFNTRALVNPNSYYFQVLVEKGLSGEIELSYEIKLERGSTATPYQPNLIEEPYQISHEPLGKNIANKDIQFPIKSSEYLLYKANMEEEYVIGQTYTVTIKGTKPASQTFIAYNDGIISFGNLKPVEGLTDVWSLTFTPTKIALGKDKEFRIFQYPSSTVGACQIDWLKIEKGDTRTPNIDSYTYHGTILTTSEEPPKDPNAYTWSSI